MLGVKKHSIAALLSAALMRGLSLGNVAAPQQRRRMWHDPARVEAAQRKRERRADRNIHIARQGGIEWLGL